MGAVMEAWGAGTLGMAVEGGLLGGVSILAVALLRPEPRWSAMLLLVGLVHFLVPALVGVGPIRPTLIVEAGYGGGAVGAPSFLAIVALLQWGGLGVGLLVLCRSLLTVRRTLKRATHVREGPLHAALQRAAEEQDVAIPRLYLTGDVGPAAVGVFRPALLLPREAARKLEPEALRMILAHEVAHLARRDTLVAPLRFLVVALWWFHPVAWLLARWHREAAEDACDDRAVRGANPRAYCRALLDAAKSGADPGVMAPLASGLGGHPLGRRFRRLIRAGAPSRARGTLSTVVAVASLLAAPAGLLTFETGVASTETIVVHEVVVTSQARVVRTGVD